MNFNDSIIPSAKGGTTRAHHYFQAFQADLCVSSRKETSILLRENVSNDSSTDDLYSFSPYDFGCLLKNSQRLIDFFLLWSPHEWNSRGDDLSRCSRLGLKKSHSNLLCFHCHKTLAAASEHEHFKDVEPTKAHKTCSRFILWKNR